MFARVPCLVILAGLVVAGVQAQSSSAGPELKDASIARKATTPEEEPPTTAEEAVPRANQSSANVDGGATGGEGATNSTGRSTLSPRANSLITAVVVVFGLSMMAIFVYVCCKQAREQAQAQQEAEAQAQAQEVSGKPKGGEQSQAADKSSKAGPESSSATKATKQAKLAKGKKASSKGSKLTKSSMGGDKSASKQSNKRK